MKGEGEKGFTIIELLVVLAILGIVMGVAFCGVVDNLPRTQDDHYIQDTWVDDNVD